MDVIGQDADGNSLERTSIFDRGVDTPQAFDVLDQQIAATLGECEREEEHSAFDLKPTIARHPSLPSRSGGHGAARLCPPYTPAQSTLMLAKLITFAHLTAALAISVPNCAGVIGSGTAPSAMQRSLSAGSASAALMPLLSVATMASAVPRG